jgi:hypothetical protein
LNSLIEAKKEDDLDRPDALLDELAPSPAAFPTSRLWQGNRHYKRTDITRREARRKMPKPTAGSRCSESG